MVLDVFGVVLNRSRFRLENLILHHPCKVFLKKDTGFRVQGSGFRV